MTRLFGDLFDEIYYYSAVICVFEKNYLCMLLNLFEDVTSKFLYNRMISVIYRFKGLKRYICLHTLFIIWWFTFVQEEYPSLNSSDMISFYIVLLKGA